MEISKAKVSLYSSLSSKKMREKHGMFVVEGEKCVIDTLGAFELVNIIATPEWLTVHDLPEYVGPEWILESSPANMKRMSSLSTPSSVMSVFRLPEDKTAEMNINGNLVLVLDGIQDPGNMGTIIRTADWFGFDRIFASKETVDLYNPKTIQATMGALRRVKVHYVDLLELFSKNPEMPVYGTLLDGTDLFKSSLGNVGFIVMGNEGRGLTPKVRERVTDPLLIPPYNVHSHCESLNVGAATAITLAAFRNKR